MKKFFGLTLVSFFAFSSLAYAAATQQTSAGGMAIYPTYSNAVSPHFLVYELKPGETIEDFFTVKNGENKAETFSLYAADHTLTQDLRDAYMTKDKPKLFASKWIQPEKDSITLQPNEAAKIKITINIPKDAPLNDFTAGIAMEKVTQDPNRMLKIAVRQILPVKIKVTNDPKPVPKFTNSTSGNNGSVNIFGVNTTPYFWFSTGLFILSMGYFFWSKRKERNQRNAANTPPEDQNDQQGNQ